MEKNQESRRRILVEIAPSRKNWAEQITPYTSLIISIFAIGLSVWSAAETRNHNKLTAKPIVAFFREGGGLHSDLGISILNNGTGLAIIKEIRIFLDGEQMKDWESVTERTRKIFHTTPANRMYLNGLFLRGGDNLALYYIGKNDVADIDEFKKLIFERVLVVSKVCSVYEECEYVTSH
jgi:hypothetical protein